MTQNPEVEPEQIEVEVESMGLGKPVVEYQNPPQVASSVGERIQEAEMVVFLEPLGDGTVAARQAVNLAAEATENLGQEHYLEAVR